MKNKKSLLAFLMVPAMMTVMLAGCGRKIDINELQLALSSGPAADTGSGTSDGQQAGTTQAADPLAFVSGTTLRMATGYNSAMTGMFFDAETAGEGIQLADGKTYQTGDLKPTWVEVQNRLGMVFEDKYQGNNAAKEFEYWKDRLNEIDMVSGKSAVLSEYGEAGSIVNIAEYLDYMPNFKAYLDENPIVRLSITGNTNNGAIYFSPYFDGVNDIERMPLMRTDWVQKLLDGEEAFTATACGKTAPAKYEPYMPTSGKVEIEVVKADASDVQKIAKDYDAAGNIVADMNAAGEIDGVQAVNMLREYIDKAYDGYYGSKRSNLFIGQNAAWDADELVALLRCVVANPQTLNGTDQVQGLFCREDNNNQRRIDMFRFSGVLFGVRGLESRQDYLYIGEDGMMHDARQEEATYKALERMNALAEEGLISKSFIDMSEESSKTMLENDLGFMHYDYNQTQTIFNQSVLSEDEAYMAVMVPVARWYDGTNPDGVYMRFTESWRSVKDEGWGISKAGVGADQNKLYAALKLIDYAYSPQGMILMSYGPDAFIRTNADGSYVTFSFNGKAMPVIADATYEELWAKAKGNYTNYARMYLGSTLSFVKSQAFEYQCTQEKGKEGAGHISAAIGFGLIKHPELAVTENPWYTIVPTVLPTTSVENDTINQYTDLKNKYSQQKDGENLLVSEIASGYTEQGMNSAADCAKMVSGTWGGAQYLTLKQDAWDRLMAFYNAF